MKIVVDTLLTRKQISEIIAATVLNSQNAYIEYCAAESFFEYDNGESERAQGIYSRLQVSMRNGQTATVPIDWNDLRDWIAVSLQKSHLNIVDRIEFSPTIGAKNWEDFQATITLETERNRSAPVKFSFSGN